MSYLSYNQHFLKQLDQQKNKIIHARIVALDLNGFPLQQIEGHITQGSINIDGASAIRRTCSLTLVAKEDKFEFSKDYCNWSFSTQFKLEIGVENTIDKNYPNIIWFPQGVFVITSFSTARSTNNLTITLQGKDKMCLLNGEVGGNLESQVDFGAMEEIDKNGQLIIKKIPIVDIIKNILIHYGQEKEENIIINDLDNYGLELLEYRGNSPLYLFRQGEDSTDTFLTATYQGDIKCEVREPNYDVSNDEIKTQIIQLKNLEDNNWGYTYDTISEGLLGKGTRVADVVNFNNGTENNLQTPYHIVRIKYGQTVGFHSTDLVFAGDLQANVGESLTSVLDKIKNMLGEFEYFYDVNGKFVFQQKPSIYRRNWNNSYEIKNDLAIIGDEIENKFLEKLEQSKLNTYHLNGAELVTAFNRTPQISNIKNDFSVWGQRTSVTGGNIPIHIRCAIDEKPLSYRTIDLGYSDDYLVDAYQEIENYNNKYNTELKPQRVVNFISGVDSEPEYNESLHEWNIYCDWREVIYRMANDYYKYSFLPDFKLRLAKANSAENQYQNGITGYEQYYTDIWGFWRELYDINYMSCAGEDSLYDYIYDIRLTPTEDKRYKTIHKNDISNYYLPRWTHDNLAINPQYNYWNKNVVEAPETLNFWFNLIDTNGELNQYSIKSIGRRTKTVNDTNIKAIFYDETPTIIFVDDINNYQAVSSGDYSYIQIPSKLELFSISARGQSAMDKLDALLYQHTYCTESVSITTLPIYHLQPNTRIHIEDSVLGVAGDYIATKFSIQLSHTGTMAITATKAIDKTNYY